MTRRALNEHLGRVTVSHWRRRARWAGTFAVAKRLRRQGFGLQTALLLLAGR